jgi:FMN reductase [NAD(P)H]
MQKKKGFTVVMSNPTIELLRTHRSIRSFKPDPVDDEMLDQIIEAAWRGPTSINGQEVSLIVVRDAKARGRLAELAGGQPWIAAAPVFVLAVADFHKTAVGCAIAGKRQLAHEDPEGLLVGALDAGIAIAEMMLAARSLGLGIVPIGGIRRDPQGVIDLLQLPPLTFPVCGLCIGHVANDATQKPRLPLSSFRHDETYDGSRLAADITAYDTTLADYWRRIGRTDGQPWSANTAAKYQSRYYPQVKPVAQKQGFLKD